MFSPVFYIKWAVTLVAFVILGFVLSILIEYAGVFSGTWDDQHAQQMVIKEINYLKVDSRDIPGIPKPIESVESYLSKLGSLGITSADIQQRMAALGTSPWVVSLLAVAASVLALYGIKLIVCFYSMSLFTVFVLMAINEGFMSRQLRKLGGGSESSWKYHNFKRSIKPTFVSGWMIYLMTPVSVHPNLILATMSLVFAFLLFSTISNWKKLT